jgi:PleD family two-component response regulator
MRKRFVDQPSIGRNKRHRARKASAVLRPPVADLLAALSSMSADAKPASILIIDDDAEIRYSLSRVLSSRRYQLLEAPSGEQGVAMVKKGPPPDLIFSISAWAG